IAALILLMMLTGSARADRCVPDRTTQSNTAGERRSQIRDNQIKISIATGGGPYRPAKNAYRVGERVPIVITMTNTGSQPVYVCESGTLYQDRPQPLKDGRPVPYFSFTQSMMQA